jgi:hypothetical protein
MKSDRRAAGLGLALAVAYLVVAWISVEAGLVARSPLYDGLGGIPAYRWINPPEERVDDNETPEPEEFKVQVATSGQADPGSVTTGDGQATMTFNYLPGAAEPYSFTLSMTPLDPATLAPPPDGFYFDGNAYRIDAIDDRTGQPVEGNFTTILRFSVHAPQVLALKDTVWEPMPDPLMTDADLQVSVDTPANGTFVPAGTGTRPPEVVRGGESFPWISTVLGLVGLVLLFAAAIIAVRRRNADVST